MVSGTLMLVEILRYQDIARIMRFVDETVFETPLIRAGRFRCATSDSRFRGGATSNTMVVFPRTAVWLRYAGSRKFVADPTISTIYNSGQEYSRAVVSSDGDRCEWFAVSKTLATEIATQLDPAVQDHPDRPFVPEYAPVDSALYLTQRMQFSRLLRGCVDPLEAEESVIAIVASVLRRAYGGRVSRSHSRASEAHRDLVHRARAALLQSVAGRVTLGSLAAQLGVSEFHLCRVFHEQTGMTLHSFKTEVRLRRGLEMLGDSNSDLSRIALDLGFSSHSHFSDTLRRRFGKTPTAIRKGLSS